MCHPTTKNTGRSSRSNLQRLQSKDLLRSTEAYVNSVMKKSHQIITKGKAGAVHNSAAESSDKVIDHAVSSLRQSIQFTADVNSFSFLDAGMYR